MPVRRPPRATTRTATHTVAAVGAVVVLAAGMTAVASPARADVEYGTVVSGGYTNYTAPSSGTCHTRTDPAPEAKTISANNATVRSSQSRAASTTWSENGAEVSTGTIGSTSAGKIRPLTARGGRIEFSGSASASGKPASATAACNLSLTASTSMAVDLTLPVGMWVSIGGNASVSRSGFVLAELYSTGSATQTQSMLLLGGSKTKGTVTDFLPAGTYSMSSTVSASGNTSARSSSTRSAFSSVTRGSLSMSFTPGGAGSAASGKGAKYVAPGARSCRTGWVNASVTKAGKKAKKVVFKVNGRKVQTLKGKKLKKAATVTLGGAGLTSAAKVSATITTKTGKKVTVARNYLACR